MSNETIEDLKLESL